MSEIKFRMAAVGLRVWVIYGPERDRLVQKNTIGKSTEMSGETPLNLLMPSGFFLNGARCALSVLYGSQNRQLPLLYTSSTDWFL
jgi:hypothetical protein